MTSLTQQLAAFLKARPHQWIDGRDLEFAGRYAWRSRVSDCRTQFGLTIENRQRSVTTPLGTTVTRSEYRYVPTASVFRCTCADMAEPPCGYCDGPDRDL